MKGAACCDASLNDDNARLLLIKTVISKWHQSRQIRSPMSSTFCCPDPLDSQLNLVVNEKKDKAG
jgi:hypothetical protein